MADRGDGRRSSPHSLSGDGVFSGGGGSLDGSTDGMEIGGLDEAHLEGPAVVCEDGDPLVKTKGIFVSSSPLVTYQLRKKGISKDDLLSSSPEIQETVHFEEDSLNFQENGNFALGTDEGCQEMDCGVSPDNSWKPECKEMVMEEGEVPPVVGAKGKLTMVDGVMAVDVEGGSRLDELEGRPSVFGAGSSGGSVQGAFRQPQGVQLAGKGAVSGGQPTGGGAGSSRQAGQLFRGKELESRMVPGQGGGLHLIF